MIRLFSLLMVLVTITACNADRQPPLPYAVMPRDASLLSGIISYTAVEVNPPEGVAVEIATPLANALALALQEQDIPAVTGRSLAGSHVIKGNARLETGAIIVIWKVYDPAGTKLGEVEVRDALSGAVAAEKPLAPGVVEALTSRAAATLAAHFPATGGQGGGHGENLRVYVSTIANAPGDGGVSLPLALRNALHAAGLTVVEQADATTIRIEGQVLLSELDAANQLVKLSWKVLAPDGAQIGLIDQSNPVATGSLSGHWGELAYAAAQGAADGVIPLLQDYQSQRAIPAKQ